MVTAAWGDPAMGGEGTTPSCCGFEILQNCWGTRQSQRNRRVQPEGALNGMRQRFWQADEDWAGKEVSCMCPL
ncbi:hypothetical protein QQF64_022827 [Cirrhinus molitorella]|uniref:Uncharacterized protein n=1 Tax=Cirrhinus molitorella TaxID=172907 RepID=A0ABR3L5Y1_9TELE